MSSAQSAVVQTFAAEAEEILQRLEGELDSLEGTENAEETIGSLFREAHTLKGSALIAGLRAIGELAHVLEELFVRWRDGKLVPHAPQIQWARAAVDMLRDSLRLEVTGHEDTAERGQQADVDTASGFLRVSLSQLNEIADTIGEIALARARERALVADLPFETRGALVDAYEATERHYADLHEQSLRLRLVSFQSLFATLGRAAQQVARKLGKNIVLNTVGADLEVDAAIVSSLKDPLMHMVRNAVDHGIENPDVRVKAGKPEAGHVTLSARRSGGQVVVELIDDGKGLDRERILAKAQERGRNLRLENLTDELLAELIFEPGFSTAREVTDVSGRGVGMDVVRSNVLAMRGSILVRSEVGKGSTFEIQVPLALAIVDGFHVTVAGHCFVLPAENVERCLETPAVELVKNGAKHGECVRFNGALLPLVRLSRALGLSVADTARHPAVVVRNGGELIAFGVDALHGEQPTVVRTLGPMFQSIKPVTGATVLGNGEVALLLDVQRVVEAARLRLAS